MSKVVDRGSYWEVQSSGDWGAAMSQIADAFSRSVKAIQAQKEHDQELKDAHIQMVEGINKMSVEEQDRLKANQPEVWKLYSDPDYMSHPGKPHNVKKQGEITPLPVREKTPLEIEQYNKAQEETLKATSEANKAETEATRESKFLTMMDSPDPVTRLQGIKKNVLSSDELFAGAIPQQMINAKLVDLPGTKEHAEQQTRNTIVEWTKTLNPRTPEEQASIVNWARFGAGLTDEMPKDKVPLSFSQKMEAQRNQFLANADQRAGAQEASRVLAEKNTYAQAFTARYLQMRNEKGERVFSPTDAAQKGFDSASEFVKTGKLPKDIPADVMGADLQATNLGIAQENLRKLAASNPQFEAVMSLAQQSKDPDQKAIYTNEANRLYQAQYGKPMPMNDSSIMDILRSPLATPILATEAGLRLMGAMKDSMGPENVTAATERLQNAPSQPGATTPGGPGAHIGPTPPQGMSFDDKEKVKFISNMQTWIESSIKTAPAGVRLKYASWLERVKQYKDGKIDFDTVLKELPQ